MQSRAELLHLANHRPQNTMLLDPLVEEMDERLDGEQQEEILRVVREAYGLPEPSREDCEGEGKVGGANGETDGEGEGEGDGDERGKQERDGERDERGNRMDLGEECPF